MGRTDILHIVITIKIRGKRREILPLLWPQVSHRADLTIMDQRERHLQTSRICYLVFSSYILASLLPTVNETVNFITKGIIFSANESIKSHNTIATHTDPRYISTINEENNYAGSKPAVENIGRDEPPSTSGQNWANAWKPRVPDKNRQWALQGCLSCK